MAIWRAPRSSNRPPKVRLPLPAVRHDQPQRMQALQPHQRVLLADDGRRVVHAGTTRALAYHVQGDLEAGGDGDLAGSLAAAAGDFGFVHDLSLVEIQSTFLPDLPTRLTRPSCSRRSKRMAVAFGVTPGIFKSTTDNGTRLLLSAFSVVWCSNGSSALPVPPQQSHWIIVFFIRFRNFALYIQAASGILGIVSGSLNKTPFPRNEGGSFFTSSQKNQGKM